MSPPLADHRADDAAVAAAALGELKIQSVNSFYDKR
jgi:hypothetical protein